MGKGAYFWATAIVGILLFGSAATGTFTVGLWDTEPFPVPTWTQLVLGFVVLELLAYQGRYLLNDITDASADGAHPDRASRGRLEGRTERQLRRDYHSALRRIGLAILLASGWVAADDGRVAVAILIAALMQVPLAVLYRLAKARASRDAVGAWCHGAVLGVGYSTRAAAGIAYADVPSVASALAIVGGVGALGLGVVYAFWAFEQSVAPDDERKNYLRWLRRWIPAGTGIEVEPRRYRWLAPAGSAIAPWNSFFALSGGLLAAAFALVESPGIVGTVRATACLVVILGATIAGGRLDQRWAPFLVLAVSTLGTLAVGGWKAAIAAAFVMTMWATYRRNTYDGLMVPYRMVSDESLARWARAARLAAAAPAAILLGRDVAGRLGQRTHSVGDQDAPSVDDRP